MEGHLELAIPGVTASTYYKIIGDLSSTPLIVIHGGPSAGHEYLLPFAALWKRYHIPVIFYDQIGCAGSTRLPEKDGDRSFWTMDLFLAELQQLIDHLGLEDYHILGQSWGGMIAPVFAAKRPKGLRKLILASGISDASTLRAGSRALVDALQDEFKLPIQRAMDTENFGDEFKTAMNGFNQAYVWAHGMPPPELIKAMTNVGETRIHRTVLGRSFLTMRDCTTEDYSSIDGLSNIAAPTLVYYGELDTSHRLTQEPFKAIPDVKEYVVQGSGHFCHMEPGHEDEVLELVGKFLA